MEFLTQLIHCDYGDHDVEFTAANFGPIPRPLHGDATCLACQEEMAYEAHLEQQAERVMDRYMDRSIALG